MRPLCSTPHCMARQVGVIYGNPEITSGGVALKYYSSIRLEVRKKAAIKGPNTGDDDIGIRVKGKVCTFRANMVWNTLCWQLFRRAPGFQNATKRSIQVAQWLEVEIGSIMRC